ncbi:hypothetical protein ACSSS7_002431 [Eimeria intestinalis]
MFRGPRLAPHLHQELLPGAATPGADAAAADCGCCYIIAKSNSTLLLRKHRIAEPRRPSITSSSNRSTATSSNINSISTADSNSNSSRSSTTRGLGVSLLRGI